MSATSCTMCVFFDKEMKNVAASEDAGVCRFNPPSPQPISEKKSLWPIVTPKDWCGHFTEQRTTRGIS